MNWLAVWHDYLSVITYPGHILAEFTFMLLFDVILGAVLWPLVKRAVRTHDRKVHNEGGQHVEQG